MADGLQQQVDEHSQLLGLTTCQETQNDGGPGGSSGFPLELTACFTAQTPKQEPVSSKIVPEISNKQQRKNICYI